MRRKCRVYETDEYKFIDFGDILKNTRDLFLDELELIGADDNITLKTRLQSKYIKHCAITEVLMTYEIIDSNKKNVIVIGSDVKVDSGGLFDDKLFAEKAQRYIHSCKRKIPILIKMVSVRFDELETFNTTGEGVEWLNILENDRERLKKATCSFQEFKKYAKKEGLTHINDNLVNKMEFKRLFFS